MINIDTIIDSTVHHLLSVYNTGIAESSLTACALDVYGTNLGTRKLGYLRVSYRILERNFYESAQSNGVEQYSEQSSKPLSQQSISKKAERLIYHRCIMSDRPSNLLKHFLLVTLPYMNDMISISIHKELQSCLHLSSSLLLH